MRQIYEKNEEVNSIGDGEMLRPTDGLIYDNCSMEMVPASLDRKSDMKCQLKDGESFKSAMLKINKLKVVSRSLRSMEKGSSRNNERTAVKAAAVKAASIKDRENRVAKLEGMKQRLEKILEEHAKQQVQEVSTSGLFQPDTCFYFMMVISIMSFH
ncbi:unnamed protein product [Fraxinus pennsylvanica]|uniref:Uncharacterized protein n=1 Tax=Fraxinus pennsylvanica TaxID=56036 RepID=A0AAD2E022_9LAMI|nr:unnamed protein product [Fraxinus pennsylvanica]